MSTSSHQRPFDLPLDREQFRIALSRGYGRARMHLDQHGVTGFEDLLVQACLRDLRYDPSCEDNRSNWLLDLLEGAELDILPPLMEALKFLPDADDEDGHRDLAQQCRLAYRFARRHRSRIAHTALYAAFEADTASKEPAAMTEIIDLDGADGLIHIAETLGAKVQKNPTGTVSETPLDRYEGRHGPGSAERVLWSAARYSERVAAYVMRLAAERDGDTKEVSRFLDVQSMTVEEIIRAIESENPEVKEYALRGWGRQAQRWELMTLIGRLYRENRPARMARYLSVFQSRAVPIFHRRLVRYAEHDDEDVRWYAVYALANHRHPVVRSLALSRADSGRHTDRELRLFRKNYQEGDWRRIESGLRLPDDIDKEHSILCDVIDIFEENEGPDARTPLLMVYERSPCSLCRENAVDLLLAGGLGPAWLLEECRYDCDTDIRVEVTPPEIW